MIIGITGGIASGKSTVVKVIRKAGYQVIDADQVVHDLQEKGGRLYEALREAFGNQILKADGELDRTKLSEMLFQTQIIWQHPQPFKIKSLRKNWRLSVTT